MARSSRSAFCERYESIILPVVRVRSAASGGPEGGRGGGGGGGGASARELLSVCIPCAAPASAMQRNPLTAARPPSAVRPPHHRDSTCRPREGAEERASAPGKRAATALVPLALSASTSRATWVDLPLRSSPSKTMKAPRRGRLAGGSAVVRAGLAELDMACLCCAGAQSEERATRGEAEAARARLGLGGRGRTQTTRLQRSELFFRADELD